MDIIVHPTKPKGIVAVSGNKNAALPVLATAVLNKGKVTLYNIPNITDVQLFLDFYKSIGVKVNFKPKKEILVLDFSSLKDKNSLTIKDPGKLTRIRASILLISSLAVRFKKIKFAGAIAGCNLGLRPLIVHFDNLKKLGARVKNTEQYIEVDTTSLTKKQNKFLWQKERSVTGTEVAMILATALNGKTTIYNAASEPHVLDTAEFLEILGYKVEGKGTDKITISSNGKLPNIKNVKYAIRSDHHEITTWLVMGAITGSKIKVVHNLDPLLLTPMQNAFEKFGISLRSKQISDNELFKLYKKEGGYLGNITKRDSKKLYVTTLSCTKIRLSQEEIKQQGYIELKPGPWPALPVDLLSLYVPLAAYSSEQVLFHNWMYDGGLFWTLELRKAGVNVIMADPHRVVVKGGRRLVPAQFEAPYIIRATISLAIFATSLKAPSTILNAATIERGHPYFFEKYHSIGGKIQIIK